MKILLYNLMHFAVATAIVLALLTAIYAIELVLSSTAIYLYNQLFKKNENTKFFKKKKNRRNKRS